MASLTSDNMRELLRPVVEDAAGSLDSGGYVEVKEVMGWFDGADIEALQFHIMYGVQRGILSALDLAVLPEMDGVPTIDERAAGA